MGGICLREELSAIGFQLCEFDVPLVGNMRWGDEAPGGNERTGTLPLADFHEFEAAAVISQMQSFESRHATAVPWSSRHKKNKWCSRSFRVGWGRCAYTVAVHAILENVRGFGEFPRTTLDWLVNRNLYFFNHIC